MGRSSLPAKRTPIASRVAWAALSMTIPPKARLRVAAHPEQCAWSPSGGPAKAQRAPELRVCRFGWPRVQTPRKTGREGLAAICGGLNEDQAQHLGRLPRVSGRALMGYFVQPRDRHGGQDQRT